MSYEKLIPLLGSPSDGEVLAAARAIDRRLKTEGRDWHWLAARLREPPPVPNFAECVRILEELALTRALSPKEAAFVKNMRAKVVLFTSLTPWQRKTIAAIHRRYQ